MQRLYPNRYYHYLLSNLLSLRTIEVGGFFAFLLLLLPFNLLAEGSKELTQNGGYRAHLYSSTDVSLPSFPFSSLGTMKVYVKVGETIYAGSSAQGMFRGTINLRAPDGSTFTSGASTTVGRISNRTQEVAGPLPNANGYEPYTHVVAAGQEGVWEIDFVGPTNTATNDNNPLIFAANSNWIQSAGPYIAAFDVSVRNTTNTAFLTGRVFTNLFSGLMSDFSIGFNGIFYILTKDGYQYIIDNNGQAGNGFSFFSNNKGFRNAAGVASYKSVNSAINLNVQDPTKADTESDVTHKIFFNVPAADLPISARTPGNSSTWLINPPFVPTATDINFKGTEGATGTTGSTLGGTINFATTSNGTYRITIDANRNGVFSDPVDAVLTGVVSMGNNSVIWNGLDGQGNKLAASGGAYTANINLSLRSAEVHFPFVDVERNFNGIKLRRVSGSGAPDNTIYWDDSDIIITEPPPKINPSSPIVNLTGIDSYVNGHKWGTQFYTVANSDFGNEKAIDTWAYVASAVINTSVTFTIQEADLEISSLIADAAAGCVNQDITYTAVVKNNGPSDVVGSTYSFKFPEELTNVVVTSVQSNGTSVLSNEKINSTSYSATLDILNGAVRTFTIKGKVTKLPAGNNLNVSSAILRPADISDPDATNADNNKPTDPYDECDAPPSGVGCNNIKTNSINIAEKPSAGADQIIEKNKTVTLTGNTTGTWLQIGTTPTVALINTPTATTTTVSGFLQEGDYKFTFTNANGCADTVIVNVISTGLDGAANVITPNNDGKNDTFSIPSIQNYPGSKLSIFNRWGNEVYRSDNYKNDWDGKGLSEGTYFYQFNRVDKAGVIKVFKGWIYLKR